MEKRALPLVLALLLGSGQFGVLHARNNMMGKSKKQKVAAESPSAFVAAPVMSVSDQLLAVVQIGNQADATVEGIVRRLLDKGASVRAVDKVSGRTALQWAVANGFARTTQVLLDAGANVFVPAVFEGVPGSLAQLAPFTAGIIINAIRQTQDVFANVKKSSLPDVRTDFTNGASLNATDALGRTPLHYAAALTGMQGAQLCNFLLDNGANVFAMDMSPQPYMASWYATDADIVNILKDTASLLAVVQQTKGTDVGVGKQVAVLLANVTSGGDATARLGATDAYGKTALHWAVKNGWITAAAMLLAVNASSNVLDNVTVLMKGPVSQVPDITGNTPWDYAGKGVQDKVQKELMVRLTNVFSQQLLAAAATIDGGIINKLSNNALFPNIINARDENGNTPFNLLVQKGGRTLLSVFQGVGGFNPDLANNGGNTPLHSAVLVGTGIVSAVLAISQKSVNTKNKAGQTPLDLAVAEKASQAIIDALAAAGAKHGGKAKKQGKR